MSSLTDHADNLTATLVLLDVPLASPFLVTDTDVDVTATNLNVTDTEK